MVSVLHGGTTTTVLVFRQDCDPRFVILGFGKREKTEKSEGDRRGHRL